jgi:hypothetical protein
VGAFPNEAVAEGDEDVVSVPVTGNVVQVQVAVRAVAVEVGRAQVAVSVMQEPPNCGGCRQVHHRSANASRLNLMRDLHRLVPATEFLIQRDGRGTLARGMPRAILA